MESAHIPNDPASAVALEFLQLAQWDGMPVPDRLWAVENVVPLLNVTLLSGDGAIGKSNLMLQLCCSTALASDWIGFMPTPGPAIYLGAEDDTDEIHRRLARIIAAKNMRFASLTELHVASLAGKDAVLGVANRSGIVRPTPLYDALMARVLLIRPRIVALDTAADIFAGNENDRGQVRQFVGMLRALALAAAIATGNPANGAAVVLASHPSVQGMHTDSGLSGSTAWHNSVRSRLYLKSATNGDASHGDNTGLRVLEMRKSNYGPLKAPLALRWIDGVFVPERAPDAIARAKLDQDVEQVFLALLARYARDGRSVSDKLGRNYAPTRFAAEPEAENATPKITVKDFAAAMTRLFAAQKISLISYGRPSNLHQKITATELPL